MPCKHEGGTGLCERYTGGGCKVSARRRAEERRIADPDYNRRYHLEHKEDLNEKSRKYHEETYKSSQVSAGRQGDSGYAGELIVRTDLLLKGFDVTVPENRCSPDDLHFKSSKGWMSIQVKVALVNKKTGAWKYNLRGRTVSSDVLAWVDLHGKEIRYLANTKPVPPELLT